MLTVLLYGLLAASVALQVWDFGARRSLAAEHRDQRRVPWLRYAVFGALPAVIMGMRIYDFAWGDRERVARWLNISSPPGSLWVLDCRTAPLPTDVAVDCEAILAPDDFDALLKGRSYDRQPHAGPTVVTSAGARDFDATDQYVAWPPEFKNGGAVSVYASARRDRVVIDLYIE